MLLGKMHLYGQISINHYKIKNKCVKNVSFILKSNVFSRKVFICLFIYECLYFFHWLLLCIKSTPELSMVFFNSPHQHRGAFCAVCTLGKLCRHLPSFEHYLHLLFFLNRPCQCLSPWRSTISTIFYCVYPENQVH